MDFYDVPYSCAHLNVDVLNKNDDDIVNNSFVQA